MLTKAIKKLTDKKETTIGFVQAGTKVYKNENLNLEKKLIWISVQQFLDERRFFKDLNFRKII